MISQVVINTLYEIFVRWRDAGEVFKTAIETTADREMKKQLIQLYNQILVFSLLVEDVLKDLECDTEYIISPDAEASCWMMQIHAGGAQDPEIFMLGECEEAEENVYDLYRRLYQYPLPSTISSFVKNQRDLLEANIDYLRIKRQETAYKKKE